MPNRTENKKFPPIIHHFSDQKGVQEKKPEYGGKNKSGLLAEKKPAYGRIKIPANNSALNSVNRRKIFSAQK